MILDLLKASERLRERRYDVCVCGTGPAGITVARTIAGSGKSVCLLEAGGMEYTDESADIYEGETTGLEYWSLSDCRLRYFGGTSNHWAGRCSVFDPIDFEQRDYFGLPGWPISYEEFIRHLPAGKGILDLGDQDVMSPKHPKIKGENFHATGKAFSPPTRFSEKYGDELKQSELIDVYLNASAVDIRLADNATEVTGIFVRDPGGQASEAKADAYVLALGAIENARLLLNSDSQVANGVGNHSDFVGRCFMEHFDVSLGRFLATDQEFWTNKNTPGWTSGGNFPISPSPKLLREHNIGNSALAFNPSAKPRSYGRLAPVRRFARSSVCASETLTDAARYFWDFNCPGDGVITTLCEQAPNRDSRVTLIADRDALGLRRARLDWRFSDRDRRTIRTLAMEAAKEMARLNLARVQLKDYILDEALEPEPGRHCHHIGTTRMSADPAFGVVDANCKVHNTDNLYIAGSGVFPTGGGTGPTLPLVMMSARLGEHLAAG